MSWRVTGTELLTADELLRRGWDGRRRADVRWVDGAGLVAAPGSEWVLDHLRRLDGKDVGRGAADAPVIRLDINDEAANYWVTLSLLYRVHLLDGELPDPIWDPTTEGSVN
jgi:hypothetical protein